MTGINKGCKPFPCTCRSEQQDKIYGKGIRLHNYCKNTVAKEDMKGLRCTVCAKVKDI